MGARSKSLSLFMVGAAVVACGGEPQGVESQAQGLELPLANRSRLPNEFPMRDANGFAATFSTAGFVDLTSQFFTPQGTNGRDCATCHVPESGWSIRPADVQRRFDETDGLDPIFNVIDANTPVSDVSTVEARRRSFSMLLEGKFLRLRSAPANAEFEVTAADDPFGFGTTAKLLFFRRPLPTANFRSFTVMWDGANTVGTDLRAGLVKQAKGNVTGAQQGAPAPDAVIDAIVDYELALSHAQLIASKAGLLHADGAEGGPEAQSEQALVQGPFDVFDAWTTSHDARRRQIARGQALFNDVNPNGRRCGGCHNAANNGQNVNGTLFDVGTSAPERRNADMAVYTFRNRTTSETLQSTDPGFGFVTGHWADLNRFKTPNLRGLSARAPYFHNGIATTLLDVVHHYETALGFTFTPQEEADLVAFLGAL